MVIHPINILSICTGSGMLDIGVGLAIPNARTICVVEHEAYACEVLATRMEEKALDDAPIWSDLRTFDGRPWRGIVHGLVGGFPCQPFSCAGKRLGANDERHLWPEIARIIEESRPELCFFENVPGLVTTGTVDHRSDLLAILSDYDLAHVVAKTPKEKWYINYSRTRFYRRFCKPNEISALLYIILDLERMGYRVAAGLFSAAEVGASHQRERLFILAVADAGHRGIDIGTRAPGRQAEQWTPERGVVGGNGHGHLANPESAGRGQHGMADAEGGNAGKPSEFEGRENIDRRGAELADAECGRSQDAIPASARWGEGDTRKPDNSGLEAIPLFAPAPGDREAWAKILEADPTLEPAICRAAHGLASGVESSADQLRLTGNGVCTLAATYAFASLAAVLSDRAGTRP